MGFCEFHGENSLKLWDFLGGKPAKSGLRVFL